MSTTVNEVEVERLRVRIFANGDELGRAAAGHTAQIIRAAVAERGSARMIIATGNSQLTFVRMLRQARDVPWHAVAVFHMDEYLELDPSHPASFRRWIHENIGVPLQPSLVHYIDGTATDPEAECHRYEELLREAPVDLVCMGIGENGHLAFNEPNQADFDDPKWARIITLQETSRVQQVGEGHFPSVADTPERAITLTVPALLAARRLQVVVPEQRKAPAVRAALTDPVSPACPATILRRQDNATLFLDRESASAAALTPPTGPTTADSSP